MAASFAGEGAPTTDEGQSAPKSYIIFDGRHIGVGLYTSHHCRSQDSWTVSHGSSTYERYTHHSSRGHGVIDRVNFRRLSPAYLRWYISPILSSSSIPILWFYLYPLTFLASFWRGMSAGYEPDPTKRPTSHQLWPRGFTKRWGGWRRKKKKSKRGA